MKAHLEVLTAKERATITGYNPNSVSKKCSKDLIKYFPMGNPYLGLKTYLLEFMMGLILGNKRSVSNKIRQTI